MVTKQVLFDTNILIDHLSGVVKACAVLERHPDRAISIITWMEVMAGTHPDEESKARALLLSFRILPVTQEVAEAAYLLRRERRISSPTPSFKRPRNLITGFYLHATPAIFPSVNPASISPIGSDGHPGCRQPNYALSKPRTLY